MRHTPREKQQEILLQRRADQPRPAPPPRPPAKPLGRTRSVLETLAGLLFGVPLGAALYYVIAAAVYYPVMLCLLLLGGAAVSGLHVLGMTLSASLDRRLTDALDYGPVIDVGLAAVAVYGSYCFTRNVIRQGYWVLAWVQLPLILATSLTLFYWTFAHHKPLFPFYEQ